MKFIVKIFFILIFGILLNINRTIGQSLNPVTGQINYSDPHFLNDPLDQMIRQIALNLCSADVEYYRTEILLPLARTIADEAYNETERLNEMGILLDDIKENFQYTDEKKNMLTNVRVLKMLVSRVVGIISYAPEKIMDIIETENVKEKKFHKIMKKLGLDIDPTDTYENYSDYMREMYQENGYNIQVIDELDEVLEKIQKKNKDDKRVLFWTKTAFYTAGAIIAMVSFPPAAFWLKPKYSQDLQLRQ